MKKYPRFTIWSGISFRYDKVCDDKIMVSYKHGGKHSSRECSEASMATWEQAHVTDYSSYEFSHEEAVLMPEFDHLR